MINTSAVLFWRFGGQNETVAAAGMNKGWYLCSHFLSIKTVSLRGKKVTTVSEHVCSRTWRTYWNLQCFSPYAQMQSCHIKSLFIKKNAVYFVSNRDNCETTLQSNELYLTETLSIGRKMWNNTSSLSVRKHWVQNKNQVILTFNLLLALYWYFRFLVYIFGLACICQIWRAWLPACLRVVTGDHLQWHISGTDLCESQQINGTCMR